MAESIQYNSGMIVDTDRLIKLKEKVKKECLRRSYVNSVASYGGAAYDFETNPANGTVIKAEYYDKNATPLNAINNNPIDYNNSRGGVPKAKITPDDNIIFNDEIYNMDYRVSQWMTIDKTNNQYSGCANNCAGLCLSCTNSCVNGCTQTCTKNCANDCTGTCGVACQGYCEGCGSGCSGVCSSSCNNNCRGTCTVTCGNAGCSGGCRTSCVNKCSYDSTTDSTPGCRACGTNCTGACTVSASGGSLGAGSKNT